MARSAGCRSGGRSRGLQIRLRYRPRRVTRLHGLELRAVGPTGDPPAEERLVVRFHSRGRIPVARPLPQRGQPSGRVPAPPRGAREAVSRIAAPDRKGASADWIWKLSRYRIWQTRRLVGDRPYVGLRYGKRVGTGRVLHVADVCARFFGWPVARIPVRRLRAVSRLLQRMHGRLSPRVMHGTKGEGPPQAVLKSRRHGAVTGRSPTQVGP